MVTKKTSKKVSKKVVKKTGLRRIKSSLPKKTRGGIIKSKKTINNELGIVLRSLSRITIVFVVCAVLFVVILVGIVGSKL